MPVTKTAKRALRSSQKKRAINLSITKRLEIATKKAKKSKTKDTIKTAVSLADKAAKKGVIHANKASRIKSSLLSLVTKAKTTKTLKN